MSKQFLITLELYTESAMQEEYNALVDKSTRRQVLPGSTLLLHVLVCSSSFLYSVLLLMFAENVTDHVRFEIAREYVVAIDQLVASGNRDPEEAAEQRRVFQSFLMRLDTGHSFGEARLNATPPGIFLTQFKGARVVAQNVGLRTGDFLCFCALSNKEVTGEVLKAHGLSPYSSLVYPCGGLRA